MVQGVTLFLRFVLRFVQSSNFRVALLKTFGREFCPLTAEDIGQNAKGCFGDHLVWAAGLQRAACGAFQAAEETFDRPASAKTAGLQVFRTHQRSPAASPLPICPPLNRFDDALNAPLFPALRMQKL